MSAFWQPTPIALLVTVLVSGMPFNPSLSRVWEMNSTAILHPACTQRATAKRSKCLCPEIPTDLEGPLSVPDTEAGWDFRKARPVQYGGIYTHPDCQAREKVALIIPQRHRKHHLRALLAHLHPFLQRQQLDYTVIVSEPALPSTFNKGIAVNVGYLTAMAMSNFTCVVIHDVDLLPLDDRNLYRCGHVPRHLFAKSSKDSVIRKPKLFGGVVAVRPWQFEMVNGFSNLYFGWGSEDTDLREKFFYHNMTFSRPRPEIGRYHHLPHPPDPYNMVSSNRLTLMRSMVERMAVDGLNSLLYRRLALELRPKYTWIHYKVKEADILQANEEFLYPTDDKAIEYQPIPAPGIQELDICDAT